MSDATKPLSVKKNMFWNSCGSIIYYVSQWLMTIIVVRISGTFDNAGILAVVMSIYNIFQPFAVYRMYTYQISDINKENSTGEYFAFRCFTCFAAFLACSFYAFITSSYEVFIAVVLYCIYKSISLLVSILQGREQLAGRMDYIGKSLAFQGIFALMSFSVILEITGSIHYAIASMIGTNLLVAIFYDYPKYRKFEKLSIGISRKKIKQLVLRCFPAVISSVALSASFSIARQYLSLSYGDAALGIYASIAAPAAIVQMGATYIYNPLLGTFSENYFQNKKKKFIKLLIEVMLGILLVGVISTVVLYAISPWLFLLLFGEEILSYVYLLMPVMALTTVTALVWLLNDLLVAIRAFKASFIGNIVTFVISIPATFLCVNVWGMNGVSFAGIISCIAGVLAMMFFINKMVLIQMKEKKQ